MIGEWTEEAALARWERDKDAERAAAEVVRRRLEEPPATPGDVREEAYRAAARRWLDRGRARVALALLDRGQLPPLPSPASPVARAGSPAARIEALLAGRPGAAGLPALTEDELAAFRAAEGPAEAVEVLRRAKIRLEAHGQEARRLLRRWKERQERS